MVDLRFGHALGFKNHNKIKAKRSSCTSGGFITSPTSGQQVDTSDQVMFAWDSSCLNITAADIYLYAPYKESSLVQMFQNVDFSKGSYNTTLKPKWWNSSSSVDLELTIVETGTLAFLATLPSGPVWTAIYNSSSDTSSSDIGTTSSTDSNVTKVNNLETSKSGLTRGQLAAAVLVPLIVIGLALAAYVKISRKREKSRRKRWSEALDKRMSVISYDWRSMSTRGAEAAIRASMADPGRNSVWSAGAAGVGAHHAVATSTTTSGQEGTEVTPEMAQIRRPGVGLRGPLPSTTGEGAGRVSRISFAADTRFSKASAGEGIGARGRPSTDSRRGNVPSRAFHSAYIPPVPSRLSEYVPEVEVNNNWDSDENENGSGMMSPTQRAGPLDLSTEDISAHMHSGSIASRPSFDAVQPALNMIRSMNEAQISLPLERVSLDTQQHQRQQQHSLPPLQTTMPTPPPAVKSPIMEAMPMEPLSAVTTMMSPDEMLRAYAERRRTGGMMSPPGSPAPMSMPIPMTMPVPMTMPIPVPAPVASPVSSTQMRVLYSPAPAYESPLPLTHRTSDSLSADSVTAGSTNPFRKSMATTKSIDTQGADEDAYLGTS